jgi:hypothetical protein
LLASPLALLPSPLLLSVLSLLLLLVFALLLLPALLLVPEVLAASAPAACGHITVCHAHTHHQVHGGSGKAGQVTA